MANKIRVAAEVSGVGKASSDLDRFRDKFERLQKQGAKGFAIGVGAGVTTAALGLVGNAVSAVTGFLGDSVRAANEEEASIARLTSSLKANVPAWDGNSAAIEKVLSARMKLGFSDDEQRASLALLVGATRDVTKALELERTAMDLARFKNIDLATASETLIRIEGGQFRALKALIGSTKDITTSEQALAAVHRVAGGAAEDLAKTTGGKLLDSQIRFNEAQEKFGKSIAPKAAEAMGFLADAAAYLGQQLDDVSTKKPLEGTGLDQAAVDNFLQPLFDRLADINSGFEQIDVAVGFRKTTPEVARHTAELVSMADHAAETFRTHMNPAIRDTGNSLGDMADDAAAAAKDAIAAFESLTPAFESTMDRLTRVAGDAADAIYDPLIRAAELAANAREIAEQRAIVAAKDSTKEQVADAQLRLLELNKSRAEMVALMVGLGEAGGAQIKTLNDTLRTELLTATDEEAAAIYALLALLDQLATKGRTTGKALRFSSKGNLQIGGGLEVRQHGGPVTAGRPVIVGEKQPELFVPRVSGTILPSVPTGGGAALGGSDAAAQWLPIIAAQLARLTAAEPLAARPQTARGDLARQAAMMPGGRL